MAEAGRRGDCRGRSALTMKPTKPQVESRKRASYASPGGPRAALWWHVSAPGLSAGCGRSCALPRRKRRYQRPPGSGQSHPPCPAGGSAISRAPGGDRTGVDWSALAGSGRQAASSAGHRAAAKRCTGPATPVAASGRVGIDLGNIPANPACIQREDVEAVIAALPSFCLQSDAPGSASAISAPNELSPTNRIRRLIAQRMADSATHRRRHPPPRPTPPVVALRNG